MSRRILFACTLNSVRSPMAAGLLQHLVAESHLAVEAAGVHAEPINPFAVAVMLETGIDLGGYIAKTLYDLPRALPFETSIALSGPAYEALHSFPSSFTGAVLFWDIPMPASEIGHRNQQLAQYRLLRDDLRRRITTHFSL